MSRFLRQKRVRLGLALALALLVSSVTAAMVIGQTPSGTDIATNLAKNAKFVQDIHATVQVSANVTGTNNARGNGAGSFEFWRKQPDKYKVVAGSLSATLPDKDGKATTLEPQVAGALAVSNGDSGWLYAPTQNIAVTGTQAELQAYADKEGIENKQSQIPDYASIVTLLTQFADLTVTGSEKIGGNDAWIVKVTPKSASTIISALGALNTGNSSVQINSQMQDALTKLLADDPTFTMWVDKSRWVLLKVSASAADKTTGANAQSAAVSIDMAVNAGIADSIFTFTPPANTRVVRAVEYLPTSLTLAAAKQGATAAGWTLREPSATVSNAVLAQVTQVKGNYSLHYAITDKTGYRVSQGIVPQNAKQAGLTDAEWTNLVQAFDKGKAEFDTALAAGKLSSDKGNVSKTTVRGQEAMLTTSSKGTASLVWKENGVLNAVYGDISAPQATQIAGSL